MLDYRLTEQELAELRAAHRRALNVREAYRLNLVILLASGWTAAQVAAALLIEPDSVRNDFKRYKHGGIEELGRMNYVGSEALLSPGRLVALDGLPWSSENGHPVKPHRPGEPFLSNASGLW